MPVNITNRENAEAIIRQQVVSTIFQDAPKQSVFMSMARKLPNMTSNQTRIRVLDFLPTAYWVDGDTGMKQTTKQAWDNVYLDAAELAVIVPIPEAVLMMQSSIFLARLHRELMKLLARELTAPLSLVLTALQHGGMILLQLRDRRETMSLLVPTLITMILSWVRVALFLKLRKMDIWQQDAWRPWV